MAPRAAPSRACPGLLCWTPLGSSSTVDTTVEAVRSLRLNGFSCPHVSRLTGRKAQDLPQRCPAEVVEARLVLGGWTKSRLQPVEKLASRRTHSLSSTLSIRAAVSRVRQRRSLAAQERDVTIAVRAEGAPDTSLGRSPREEAGEPTGALKARFSGNCARAESRLQRSRR